MTIESLITEYGLAAIFLGAGIEGETCVVAGGVLAHRHLLPLWTVWLAATSGSFVADQLFFASGRYFRDHPRVQRMAAKPGFAKALVTLERHPVLFVMGFRFLYGLRTVSPIAIGTSHIRTRIFLPLNALAAAIWAVLFTAIGYIFGHGIEELLSGFLAPDRLLPAVAIGLVVLFAVSHAVRWLHHRYALRCERAAARPGSARPADAS